jgi:hypothetical protein
MEKATVSKKLFKISFEKLITLQSLRQKREIIEILEALQSRKLSEPNRVQDMQ